jgi:hypothetical protein
LRVVKIRERFAARHRNAPNTEKLNINVVGESLLESRALFPPKRVVLSVHLVGERNLFPVVGGEESDLRETVKGR